VHQVPRGPEGKRLRLHEQDEVTVPGGILPGSSRDRTESTEEMQEQIAEQIG
jgi:hypothetical protein